MNKIDFLNKLESLLLTNEVDNTYGILREYSKKIDTYLGEGLPFTDIVEIIGKPEEIIKDYVEISFDNDETIYEKGGDNQFKKPSFESNNREANERVYEDKAQFREGYRFDNRFKLDKEINPKLARNILYILISLMLLGVIARTINWVFFNSIVVGNSTVFSFSNGLFSLFSTIPLLILIGIVIYILIKNKK